MGHNPTAVAFSLDGTRAYVTNLSSSTVSVIDVASGAVSSTIAVGRIPEAVAFSPDNKRAYVANAGNASVSVIDVETGQVSSTIAVGANPSGVAFSPDGVKAYVTNNDSRSVSVINVATGKVASTITVGITPLGVAVSPDGTKAYVANSDSNSVSVINVATGMVSSTIAVGGGPSGVAFSPNGMKAYVANNNYSVSVINVATAKVSSTIAVGGGAGGVAFSPDGIKSYITNFNDNTVSVISVATGKVSSTIAVGYSPSGVAVSPNGTKIYVLNFSVYSDSISVIMPLESMRVSPSHASVQAGTEVTMSAEGYRSSSPDSSADLGPVFPVYKTDSNGKVSGRTVTFTRAGTHAITAVLAGVTAVTKVTVTSASSPGPTAHPGSVDLDGPPTVNPRPYSQFLITGTAPAGATVTLHFHKAGMTPSDYTLTRSVTARADGTWSRAIRASNDYRYYATVPGGTSSSVLFQPTPTVDGATSRFVRINQAYLMSGTALAGSAVYLHFHKPGMAAGDFSPVRVVIASAEGNWHRSLIADTDYRLYVARTAGDDSSPGPHYLVQTR